jgi:hypothetical protein
MNPTRSNHPVRRLVTHRDIPAGAPGSFPQQASSDGSERTFLADHGPYDTDELRYVAGLWVDHIFDKNVGAGVYVRDKEETRTHQGRRDRLNVDGHWGARSSCSTPC